MSIFKTASALAFAVAAAADAAAQGNRGVFDPRPEAVEDAYSAVVVGTADLRHVTNAGRVDADRDEFDEFQWRGLLGVTAEANRGQLSFSSNYSFLDRRYSEREESNEQTVIGRSALQVGRDNRPLYAVLEHSSQEVQVDPTLRDVPENRDRRNIMVASLNSAWRLFQGNYMRLYVDYTDIQMRYSWTNEAQRTGGGLDYTRLISPLYQAGVGISAYQLDYRYLDSADYDSQRAYVWWQAELRRFDYLVQFGMDRIRLGGGEGDQTPFVNAQVSYDDGAQIWSVNYDQFITDTSQGSLNSEFYTRDAGQDGRLEQGQVDQFERQALGGSWFHRRLFAGATARISVGVEAENYVRLTDFDTRETFVRVAAKYQMNRSIDLDLSGNYDWVDFPNDPTLASYNQLRLEFGVNFTNLLRRGRLRAYVGSEIRNYSDTVTRDDYKSPFVGLSFSYGLYQITSSREQGRQPILPQNF